jgi:amino acid adenylation domain-containing protein
MTDHAHTFPMSPVQYGMLIASLRTPGEGVYVLQKRVGIRHRVEVELLERALGLLVACHPTLRTHFALEDPAGPSQVVSPEVEVGIAELDLSHLDPEAQRRAVADHLSGDLARGFAFEQAAPPTRAALLRYGEEACDFIWTSHHAMLDGRSWAIVLAQLFDLYDTLCAGESPVLAAPRPYSSYVRWREARDRTGERSFWGSQLAGVTLPSTLGVAGTPALPRGEVRFAMVARTLGEERSQQLYALAQETGVSAHNFVQAAWSILLHQASGCEEVVFGTTRACRSFASDARERVGVFLNTLPLRVSVTAAMSVTELLQSLRRRDRALREHEHASASEIRRWAAVPARTALFESVVVFENHRYRVYFQARGGAWRQRDVSFDGHTPFPFTLNGYRDSELDLQLSYDRQACTAEAAEAICGHVLKLLEAMVGDPEGAVAELPRLALPGRHVEAEEHRAPPLLSASQRRRVLEEWNATAADYPSALCVHDLVAEQAALVPGAVAVSDETETLTYRELVERSAGLVAELAARGIGRGDTVGVCLERSAAMVAALLGVLGSGATFVPLDPRYPLRRIAQMTQASGLRVTLTDERAEAGVRDAGAPLLRIDHGLDAPAGSGGTNVFATAEDIAYVIFTSGSTGRPKGVRVRHRSLTNLLWAMAASPGLTANDELLALSTICFDIAYLELFLPLIRGGRVAVCPAHVSSNGVALRELIERMRPTVIQATPSTWRMLIAAGWRGDERLKALCGGEALSGDLADALSARAAEVWNLYGPTETTIWSSAARVSAGSRVTIGRPIANTRFYVLDPSGQPVVPGLPGELHIGGDGVAAGYLGEPDLTRERFVAGLLDAGTVYRTGDVVRQLHDGRVEYLGRADNQVKHNGHRIELPEVEHALREHPGVEEAVVALRGAAGRQSLVGYLVAAAAGETPSPSVLRGHLRERIPEYMVPSIFIELPRLPLTDNAKIDRAALPDPGSSEILSDVPYAPPRAGVERTIAEIWCELLGLERVGVHETFFDLGGDSVVLVRLIEQLRARVADHITHVDAFEFPTIRALATHLAEGRPEAHGTPGASRSARDRARRLAELRARRQPTITGEASGQ